jgi:hypothetical protein
VAQKKLVDSNKVGWLEVDVLQQERSDNHLRWVSLHGYTQEDQLIPVAVFPAYNIVIKSKLACMYDQNGKYLQTLSIGTRLKGVPKKNSWQIVLPDQTIAFVDAEDVYVMLKNIKEPAGDLRKKIVAAAKRFLGDFYSWGGRSAEYNLFGNISSVDCSSFINLVFLAYGLQIPRNSHDQFLAAQEINQGSDLQPGDLIFFSTQQQKNNQPLIGIAHVMLYIGNGKLIESTRSGDCMVRIISFKKRVGRPHDEIKSGDMSRNVTTGGVVANQYYVYFASYFKDKKLLQNLRYKALGYDVF